MGKGQNEGGFSEEQIQMYKDCFKLMDINKDGVIDKNDLRGAFDNVGVLMSEEELDDLMGEVSGDCTEESLINMFQSKLAAEGNDPDDLIIQAFKAYDHEGGAQEGGHTTPCGGAAPPEEEDDGAAKKKKKKKKKAAK